jgi:hypothetical protein
MTSGAPYLRRLVRRGQLKLPWCSSWLPGVLGAEVDDAQNDSWGGNFEAWLYMAAKPSHLRVDVDGLACPLHHPTVHSCQIRG